jgi:chemotaxis protein CheZ
MKMEDIAALVPEQGVMASPEVFQQIGSITRLLHDTMQQLGVMPKLQVAADGIPDARSRLSYIATKTAAAAEKVLNSVDQAKAEHAAIADQTRSLAAALLADPVKAVASGAVFNFVNDVESRTKVIDNHLTDIMMAQDFHDLTGQVVAKVVSLANELEDSLVKLLVQVVPPDQREKVDPSVLNGPVVNPEGRTDVVANQGEVDDLLASLGF